MIQISETTANAVVRLLDDIIHIESRSRCSDAFFRSHFIDLIKAGNAVGAWQELREAVRNGEEAAKVQSDARITKPLRTANKAK